MEKAQDFKPAEERLMRELRCFKCQKLILKEYIFEGYVEFTCPRCKEAHRIHFKHKKNAMM